MWCTLPAFGAASYVPAIVLERATFVRERNDGLYRTITYLLYKIVEELIVSTILSVILSAIVFSAIELQGSYVSFWLIYWITLNTGIVLAYFVAAMSPNMDVANAALPAYVVTLLFFAGLLIQVPEMPEYWEWYSYIDFLRYSWMGLVRNQFDEAVDDDVAVAKLVYHLYEVDFMSKWSMWGMNLVFYVFFFFCAWAALVFINHTKRWDVAAIKLKNWALVGWVRECLVYTNVESGPYPSLFFFTNNCVIAKAIPFFFAYW